jgi:hypothetical protein
MCGKTDENKICKCGDKCKRKQKQKPEQVITSSK